jgi:hypothetical protein
VNRSRYHQPSVRRTTTLTDRIAASLTQDLLALRTRRLVADIVEKFSVSRDTAQLAVSLARKGSR